LELYRLLVELEQLLGVWLHSAASTEIQGVSLPLSQAANLLRQAQPVLDRICEAVKEPVASALQPIPDLTALSKLMISGAKLREIEAEHAQAAAALAHDFGDRFNGFSTDWEALEASLRWTEAFLVLLGNLRINPTLENHGTHPLDPAYYASKEKGALEAVQTYEAVWQPLQERYDLDLGPWESWAKAPFARVSQWMQELSGEADYAGDWLTYRATVKALDEEIGDSAVDAVRSVTDQSSFVPNVVERRQLGQWLDWAYSHEPILSQFDPGQHEAVRAAFGDLDRRLPLAAQGEVRRKVFASYPNPFATITKTNELGILQSELQRRRKQLPVRRLITAAPHVIQALKPCFLVSPLAVSQFLPFSQLATETLTFDTVIFDEASQVFPEDAIPAILRGKQVILAGDEKQLPPSSFWLRTETDDDDDDDDGLQEPQPDQLQGKESILKVALGLIGSDFGQAHLNVHYRSKDERLIAFSNRHFYENRLDTFPSPGTADQWLGVHDVYLPDGRYEGGLGASRTNRKEADKVVDLVFHHMRTRPFTESIGVVALSRPQADLIDHLVMQRRILERDVEARFREDGPEPFFVKNLENVQGDERDHVILSIGYGPSVTGAVHNNFGPLNTDGGERRLNVVVTRARQRFDLVHSLRPQDIHSAQRGAQLLRRYLEYAANPSTALEAQPTASPLAESESPFEEAVEQALVSRGHVVQRQVGVGGYRIDLAIVSQGGDTYDLGIECDGWTYHSAPAARDRDWLRQSVLEGLGWSIHRVWSTAWVRNPSAELDKIEQALTRTRAARPIASTPVPQPRPAAPAPTSQPESIAASPVAPTASAALQTTPPPPTQVHLEDYRQAELPSPPKWQQLGNETRQKLVQLVSQIAGVEGPVHEDVVIERIRLRYGRGRVRGRTRDNLNDAIQATVREGRVKRDGTFIWAQDDQLSRLPRQPVDGNIEHVPPGELKEVILSTSKVTFGATRQGLVVETARQLGFDRTGSRISEVIETTIQELLDEGRLVESFGMLRPGESPK
jgi:very-short-patch-repair endonuclease